jgi:hypothetical protein
MYWSIIPLCGITEVSLLFCSSLVICSFVNSDAICTLCRY